MHIHRVRKKSPYIFISSLIMHQYKQFRQTTARKNSQQITSAPHHCCAHLTACNDSVVNLYRLLPQKINALLNCRHKTNIMAQKMMKQCQEWTIEGLKKLICNINATGSFARQPVSSAISVRLFMIPSKLSSCHD